MKTPVALRLLATFIASVLAMPAHAQLSVKWITQYGSNGDESGRGIAVDAQGKIWVSGHAYPAGSNNADLFLSRLSSNGSVDFTTLRGGTGSETLGSVAIVGGSTVFISGTTDSPTVDGQAAIGNYDAVLMRYDTGGTWQGTTVFGSNRADQPYGLAGNGTNLLVGGYSLGSFDGQTSAGNYVPFLSKRNSTGGLVWTRYVGGTTDNALGWGTAFDSVGNGYLAGTITGHFSGTATAGGSDLFVARYDAAGNRTLLKQIGSSADDIDYGIQVDGSGNIYLTGATQGALGGQASAGGDDCFVMKLDSNGNVLWTRLLGGSDYDASQTLALDLAGNVWIAGYASSTFGGHTNAGYYDAFVAEYNSTGLLLGKTFFSTYTFDVIGGLAIGPDGAAYVTGYTDGVLGTASAGGSDVFVAKITGVPEPSAALLLATAGTGLLLRRRRA